MAAVKSLLVIISVGLIAALPTNNTPKGTKNMASKEEQMKYLTKFRFYGDESPDKEMKKLMKSNPDMAFRDAVKSFQNFYGLKVTGEVDEATQNLMEQPRCGNPDVNSEETVENLKKNPRRSKRYAILPGGGWRKTLLTYRIQSYPYGLSQDVVDDAIARAFDEWAKVTPLSFRKTNYYPDIDIMFASYAHGDGDPFDGQYGTLAHTFYPIYGGDAHFDKSEVWTLNNVRGTDLFQIAVHEFGHALGLDHSIYRDATMYAYYRYRRGYKLHFDDIDGVQALYGENPNPRSTTTSTGTTKSSLSTPTTTSGNQRPTTSSSSTTTTTTASTTTQNTLTNEDGSDFCSINNIDAITRNDDGKTVVFKGKYVAVLDDFGIMEGYPKPITDVYRNQFLPSGIDAAVYLDPIRILRCFWHQYRQFCYTIGSEPAATYLFKDNQYYAFKNGAFIGQGQMSDKFSGVPSGIDAVFTTSGDYIYFVKGDLVYRIQRGKTYVDAGWPISLSSNIRGLPSKIDAAFVIKSYSGQYLNYYFSGSKYYRVSNSANSVDIVIPSYPRDILPWWFQCNSNSGMLISQHDQQSQELRHQNGSQVANNLFIDQNGEVVSNFEWGTPEEEKNISGNASFQQLHLTLLFMCYLLYRLTQS